MSDERGRAATIAALFSAVAAMGSLAVAFQERPTPFRSALYSARWQALSEYSEAAARFQSALKRAELSVFLTVDTPEQMQRMTDAQMEAAARAARPVWDAWDNYVAASSKANAFWSTDVHAVLSEAEKAGRAASACYMQLGVHTDDVSGRADWWRYLRGAAADNCRSIHDGTRAREFDLRARNVLRAMTDEARTADDQFIPGETKRLMD